MAHKTHNFNVRNWEEEKRQMARSKEPRRAVVVMSCTIYISEPGISEHNI
jgi:hypothetical protein